MAESETRECTDCKSTMGEIRLIDKTPGISTHEVEYATVDAKPSFWSSRIPVAGKVRAFMCSGCGLIKHYGVPKA